MDSRLLATIIIFPIWLTLVIVFRKQRQWLLYYLLGAFGLTIMLVLMAEFLGLDQILVDFISYHVYLVSKNILHIPINLLNEGRFQIMTDSGSNVLKLGIECSAVLESSILFCLIFFYPLFNPAQKALRITFGLVLTYVINLARLVIIVLMTYKLGSDYIFVAHAGVARVFFFVCELILYWYLLTKPTVRSVGDAIKNQMALDKTAKVGQSFKLRHALTQLIVIFVFVGITTATLLMSSEWKKAFEGFTRVKRPMIYKEETEIQPDQNSNQNILGVQEERFRTINVPELGPGEDHKFKDNIVADDALGFQVFEGIRSLNIEIYVNGKFEDMFTFEGGSTPLPLEKVKVKKGDVLELKFINQADKTSSYKVKIINERDK